MSKTTSASIWLPPRDSRFAGIFFLISGIVYLLGETIGEATYAGYSVHSNSLSDLGATGTSTFWVYEPAVFSWGLFWLLGAYFLYRSKGKRISLILNLLPGIGILLVAIFPENVSLVMHSIGSVMGILFGIVAVFVSYRMIGPPAKYVVLLLGIVSLIGAGLEFGGYNSALVQQSLGGGGTERIIVYPLLIWLMMFGGYLSANSKRGSP
jgi:hypothetical membrane protein